MELDSGNNNSKDKNLSETIQSVEARMELERLLKKSIEKISAQDVESDLDALLQRRKEEREREREDYYKTREERKRSTQKRKERMDAAAEASKAKKEEKARKKAQLQEKREARKYAKKDLDQRRKARDLANQKRLEEEKKHARQEKTAHKRSEAEPSALGDAAGAAVKRIGHAFAGLEAFVKEETGLGRKNADSGRDGKPEKKKSRLALFAEREKGPQEEPVRRREGALRRIRRFWKTIRKRRDRMKGKEYYTAEKRRAVYSAIFTDCFSPLSDAWEDFLETSWNFLTTVGRDGWAVCLFISDTAVKAAFYLWSAILTLWDLVWDIRYWIEANKIVFLKRFVIFVFSVASTSIFIGSITAYEYIYYGKVLGIAKSQHEVYTTIEVLGDKLSEASGANVSLNVERDIEFRRIMGFNLDIDTDEDILNTLTYMKDLQVRAYGVFINDNMVVVLENEAAASGLLKDIQNAYAGSRQGVIYDSISFGEKITVQEVGVQLGEIWNQKDAQHYLMTGSKVEKTHVVAQGETFGQIAKKYGLTTEELAASNPGVNKDKIYIGQQLSLTHGAPLVTVHSTETATYYEKISYGTQYIDNASIYQGETEVKSRGVYGQNQIVAEVVRANGVEISRKILTTDKLSDPVDEVLYRGTKPIPPKEGTGTFAYPIRTYTITSRFGMRWGRMHTGVDFGSSTGTKIYASDGGTVTFAGWKGSYGYVVIISHGSLYETYYAHCSKLLVSAGEKVYQGQNIALVGNTGNSTGPHLHFEIRYNDNPKNPLDYL